MKITTEQWSQLRRAAFDDDPKRFEAIVSSLIRQGIAEHRAVVERSQPLPIDGRPWLASAR